MTISQTEKGQKFEALHNRSGTFVIPNPWDAGSARILGALGFEALATTSAGFAFAIGKRDGATSREELLEHLRALTAASDLPVSADLEKCFGDDPRHPIYDFGHAVERVAAAAEAARALPFRFMLTARAENFLRGRPDLDDTIRRLQAFEKAGADVLYAPLLPDIAAIKTVCAAVSKPVNVLAGRPLLSVAELAQAGVKRVSIGGLLALGALGGLLRAAREVKEHGTFTFAKDAARGAEINAMMREK